MLSKAKHLALAKNNRIIPAVRFFAPLRCAQNDKLCYVPAKAALTAIFGSTLAGRRGDRIGQFESIDNQ